MARINQLRLGPKSALFACAALAVVAHQLAAQAQSIAASTTNKPQVTSLPQQQPPQQQQQQQQQQPLQVQLGQIQQQAQRQLSQLNGLVMSAVSNSSSRYSNVLEAISNVGKVIHQQISAATNPNHVNIVTGNGGVPAAGAWSGESANNKKNEYQPIHDSAGQQLNPLANGANNYREQGEFLRQEITRRAGQLQQVVASSMDLLKNNGDMIMRRLLEQMNVRLDQAKAKADKIISTEPIAMNEVTVRALATINAGLNNLNNIIGNIVARLDAANKQDQQRLNQAGGEAGTVTLQQRLQQAAADPALPQLLDTNRLKANLHQLGQQFHQALNGSSLQQQLAIIRNQRLQQLAAVGGSSKPLPATSLSPNNGLSVNQQQHQQH